MSEGLLSLLPSRYVNATPRSPPDSCDRQWLLEENFSAQMTVGYMDAGVDGFTSFSQSSRC